MKQNTWQPLIDNWSRPVDKDNIFLGQYGLIVSLSVQNGLKNAFLVVLSLHDSAFDIDTCVRLHFLSVARNHIACFPRQLLCRITITCI